MKQTKDILEQLETEYSNIDYYQLIIDKIEKNIHDNPDIAIESCKSLFEGLGKFIKLNLDKSLNFKVVDGFKYKRAISKAVDLLEKKDETFEPDFSKSILSALEKLGNIRNNRGDISHGRLSPKPVESQTNFSVFIVSLSDSFASYLLKSFSKVPRVKDLEYEDNPIFNEKLDSENDFGFLSYSKALFEQDQVAYEQELQDRLETIELEKVNE